MEQITLIINTPPSLEVTNIPTQFDPSKDYAAQAQELVGSIPLSGVDWQTVPLLINLPGHSAIAACLLAELHGRMGHFPAIVRLRPVHTNPTPSFELAEIVNLQALRDQARLSR